MADPELRIVTKGIRELNSALKQVSADLSKELKDEMARIADKVANRIRPKVPTRTGRAAASVKGRGSTRGGAIAFGGSKAPYYPWLDFGGKVGRSKSVHRPFQKEGRYVYPTIREERAHIIHDVDEVVERLAKKAGFETHGGN